MINNNVKKMLLFVTLCVILVGIVSAADEDHNSPITEDTISNQTTDTTNGISEVKNNEITNDNKNINDNKTEKNIKTATNKIKTKASIDYVPNVPVDESTIISGTLTDINNNPLKYTSMKIDINGDNLTTKTDYYGDFYGEYLASTPGTKTITVSYTGNSKYEATTAKRTFRVIGQATTYIDLNDISDTTIGNTITISGNYYTKNFPLANTNMRININGQTHLAKTDKQGHYTYNYKTNKTGTNTITVSYPGNTNFKKATATETFNVKSLGPQTTYITLNNIKNVAYGEYTTISGRYYYSNNIPLSNTNMRIKINGQTYLAKTDKQGYYTYNYKTDRVGKNNVTVSYPGNNNFKKATNTKTFNVKITSPIYTYITLNNIKEVNNGETTTISGHYYYSNNIPLTQTTMRLNINGQTYTTKTNNNGYFTYNYKTNKAGTNTITASYPGNTNFKKATTTKTFNVKSVGPQYTYITLNNIPQVAYDEYVTISGHYYYGNNIPLTYTPMTININGYKYTAKTDKQGYFSLGYWTEKIGTNTVTASYHGNANFKAATATKTFNVKITSPIYTYIDMNYVNNTTVGNYVTISGHYYYSNNIPLTQTTMRLNINGQTYTTKTDNNGYFRYNYKTNKAGTNTVTVSYPGNNNFQAASSYETFNVNKLESKVFLDYLPESVSLGDIVSITGAVTDNSKDPIRNANVTIKINNNRYNVKTDNYGAFQYNYKTTQVGTNLVEITATGNENYQTSYDSDNFIVLQTHTVTLYPTKSSNDQRLIGRDMFTSWIQDHYGEYNTGVYVIVYDYYADELDDPADNLLINATFYFKNSKGNVISRTFEDGNGVWLSHELIPGYTLFKTVATYRKMTAYESSLWEYGYQYNPLSKEWIQVYDPYTGEYIG